MGKDLKTMKKLSLIAMTLALLFVFCSCDMLFDDNMGTGATDNTGTAGNNTVTGNEREYGIYGNYRYGEDTYEYRDDGFVYKNGTKTNKFSILDNGKLRLFNSVNDTDGYEDYDYTAGKDGLVYGDWSYSRIEDQEK